MDPVHESGPWTWSKVGVHGPGVHVLSSPDWPVEIIYTLAFPHCLISLCRSLFDCNSMKEIIGVNSARSNCCKKIRYERWAESKGRVRGVVN